MSAEIHGSRFATLNRFAGLFAAPTLLALISLATLPAVARSVDASGWGALAVGQSIGTVASLIGAAGWGLVGGPAVAISSAEARPSILRDSFVARAPLSILGAAVAASASSLLLHDSPQAQLGVQAAVGSAMASLSSTWYFTGAGRIGDLWKFDVLPKCALLLVCAAALIYGAPPNYYPAAIGGGYAISFGLTWFHEVRGVKFQKRPTVRQAIRNQLSAIAATGASSAYASSGPALVALGGGPHAAAFFSSVDRLYKFAVWAIDSAVNATQPWIRGSGEQVRPRVALAMRMHAILGLASGASFALLAPLASRILFGEELAIGHLESSAAGFSLFFFGVTLAMVRLLVLPSGQRAEYLAATVVSAVVGVPAIVAGAATQGAAGGWAGFAVASALGFAVLIRPSMRAWRDLAH